MNWPIYLQNNNFLQTAFAQSYCCYSDLHTRYMTVIVGIAYIKYNSFLVYCRDMAPATVSLTGDWAQGDDSKHDLHYTAKPF